MVDKVHSDVGESLFSSHFVARLPAHQGDPRDGWNIKRVQEPSSRRTPHQMMSDARLVSCLILESVAGYPMAAFCMQKEKSPSNAGRELEDLCMPKTIAATHVEAGV